MRAVHFEDYSNAERAAIDRAAPRLLTDFEWRQLREAAQNLVTPTTRKRKQKTWSQIARVCSEAVSQLAELTTSEFPHRPFDRQLRETILALRTLRSAVEKAMSEREAWRAKKLAGLRVRGCAEAIQLVAGAKSSKRVDYLGSVLGMWQRLGGKLTHGKNGELVDGPAWRFFDAVVRPVMGKRAPARSGFPDIVRREKRLNAAVGVIDEVFSRVE